MVRNISADGWRTKKSTAPHGGTGNGGFAIPAPNGKRQTRKIMPLSIPHLLRRGLPLKIFTPASISVSYTHLDVYKRQQQMLLSIAKIRCWIKIAIYTNRVKIGIAKLKISKLLSIHIVIQLSQHILLSLIHI